jgi:hypothetical protein
MVARDRVGRFPGRGGRVAGRAAALGSRDGQHALQVWDSERLRVAGIAGKLERVAGRVGLAGAVDLEFLVGLGRHAVQCRRADCAGWLAWAVGRRPELAQVFGALGGEWTGVPPGYGQAVRRLAALRATESTAAGPGG